MLYALGADNNNMLLVLVAELGQDASCCLPLESAWHFARPPHLACPPPIPHLPSAESEDLINAAQTSCSHESRQGAASIFSAPLQVLSWTHG